VSIKINKTGSMPCNSQKHGKEQLQNTPKYKGAKCNNHNESEPRNCHFLRICHHQHCHFYGIVTTNKLSRLVTADHTS